MQTYLDLEENNIVVNKKNLLVIASVLIRQHVSPKVLQDRMGITSFDGESIFKALIRTGKAHNDFDAVAIIGKNFPPPNGGSWNALAKWVAEYEGYKANQ